MKYSDLYDLFFSKWVNNDTQNITDDAELISQIEKKMGFIFPTDYKYFLENYGACFTRISLLNTIVDQELDIFDINTLYSIEQVKNITEISIKGGMPFDLIAIASDCNGSLFCYKRNDSNQSIWFYDHDLNTVEKINSNFMDLIKNLANL